MTQVLAAINHRLSEEYGKIELGGEEAKARCVLPLCRRTWVPVSYLDHIISYLRHPAAGSEFRAR